MTYPEFTQRFDFNPETDLLGEGGFAKVYKAWDNNRNEFVALKISPVPTTEQFSLLEEYQHVQKLQQGNIAIYLDCHRILFPYMGKHDVAYMKYYEAGNLVQLLTRQPLTDKQKRTLIDGILAGITYLHQQQPFVIHRDLKPANILIVQRGDNFIPLITDFGISRRGASDGKSFVSNSIKALTIPFAPPEQGDGEELRRNVDLWSFGVLIVYILLNGNLPFPVSDLNLTTETGQTKLRDRIRSLTLIPQVDQIEEPYQTVIRHCLVVNPATRVKSCQDVKALLVGKTVLLMPPVPPVPIEDDTVTIPPFHPTHHRHHLYPGGRINVGCMVRY